MLNGVIQFVNILKNWLWYQYVVQNFVCKHTQTVGEIERTVIVSLFTCLLERFRLEFGQPTLQGSYTIIQQLNIFISYLTHFKTHRLLRICQEVKKFYSPLSQIMTKLFTLPFQREGSNPPYSLWPQQTYSKLGEADSKLLFPSFLREKREKSWNLFVA